MTVEEDLVPDSCVRHGDHGGPLVLIDWIIVVSWRGEGDVGD